MEQRAYPGLKQQISVVGLGAGQVGSGDVSEEQASRLLNGALDMGVTLVDTARGYGLSEERIGRHIGHRRHEFILSTKVGYGVEGEEHWTGPCVRKGVERALGLLKTDVLDIVHLHSCPPDTLAKTDVIDALHGCVDRGLVRIAAYSGDGDSLDAAIDTTQFGGWMASLNICDQRIIDEQMPRLAGAGFIAKRPLANVAWRFTERPDGDYAETYWERLQAMQLDLGSEPDATALRFTAFTDGVTCVITGTKSVEHLRRNVEIVQRGPLPAEAVSAIRAAFRRRDDGWIGQT
jgi:aryl-alcohol dehydrogenase-like predicted oxidoreductase